MNLKLTTYSFVIALFILSCGETNETSSNRNESKDFTESSEVSLVLVDSFNYQLPEPEKLYNGKAYVFGEEMLYHHYKTLEILRFDQGGKGLILEDFFSYR